MDIDELKQRMLARVDELADQLVDVSHQIHAHPELAFEERFAHQLLVDTLGRHGLDVTPSAYELDTAFDARAGREGVNVAVCCEYDALPVVGHACGHNIIAAAGLGAGLAAAAFADEVGGRVRVLGTPAEEGGAGKVFMAERGALDGVDAAMMVHPADADLEAMTTIAAATFEVEYHGLAAHAAAYPQLGRNALDAAVLGYVNVAALRQHIAPTERVHGVFTKGGERPNVVPEHTAMDWMVRAAEAASLEPLKERVLRALEAGATASGCTFEHRFTGRDYADMRDNRPILDRFTRNAAAVGRTLRPLGGSAARVVGSTDMGNLSYEVPSVHPMLAVAPAGVSIHSHEFTRYAGGPEGDRAVIDGAKAMALTIADLWMEPELAPAARAAFAEAG